MNKDMSNDVNKVIVCSSCGASFDAKLNRCPYCKLLTLDGAETEYMDSLEEIKDNMEALPQKEQQKGRNIVLKQIIKILVLFLLGLAVIYALYLVCTISDNTSKNKLKEEFINEISQTSGEYEALFHSVSYCEGKNIIKD